MFRGKESSNRIELSQLVQDLLNFGVLGSLWFWGVGVGVGGTPHTCIHACACMHTHTHTCKEIANGCQHVCHDCGVFPIFPMLSLSSPCCPCHPHITFQTPFNPPPTHTNGRIPRNIKNSIKLGTNRDISILFVDLKSVENPPPMGGCIVWWMGGWMGGWIGGLMSEAMSNH